MATVRQVRPGVLSVELRGFEPLTFSLRMRGCYARTGSNPLVLSVKRGQRMEVLGQYMATAMATVGWTA